MLVLRALGPTLRSRRERAERPLVPNARRVGSHLRRRTPADQHGSGVEPKPALRDRRRRVRLSQYIPDKVLAALQGKIMNPSRSSALGPVQTEPVREPRRDASATVRRRDAGIKQSDGLSGSAVALR